MKILYHPRKENKVADALSRKLSASLSVINEWVPQLQADVLDVGLELIIRRLSLLTLAPTILEVIGTKQDQDLKLLKIRKEVQKGKSTYFRMDLIFGSRLCVSNVDDMRKQLMIEAHATPYALHPSSTKMYQDLKRSLWWHGMKQDDLSIS